MKDQSNHSIIVQVSQWMSLLGLCTDHEEGVTYQSVGDSKVAVSPLSPTPLQMMTLWKIHPGVPLSVNFPLPKYFSVSQDPLQLESVQRNNNWKPG